MAGCWEWIAEQSGLRVGVATSRREHTTSTVVLAGEQALLIDPAWDPDELDWIAADLAGSGIAITAGFATHAHHDHVLWHPGLGDAPRWACAEVVRAAAAEHAQLVAAMGSGWPVGLADLLGRLTPIGAHGLPWSAPNPPEIEPITHNAHAPGHTALWLPAARVLIAGDMLSDIELPLLEQSTPADYAAGLTALRPYVDRALAVIPGHGSPAVGAAAAAGRWQADRRYLDTLGHDDDTAPDGRLAMPGMAPAHRENREQAARSAT
ncbi:MAG: MBL fold metallo-hydrolase [Nakamurella sp.]